MGRVADTLDNTFAALLGVASRKIREFVADAVPEFQEEYREVEAKRRAHSGRISHSDEVHIAAE